MKKIIALLASIVFLGSAIACMTGCSDTAAVGAGSRLNEVVFENGAELY